MQTREAHVPSSPAEFLPLGRMKWVLVGITVLGALLSIFGARREAAQFVALERLRFEQQVDESLAELQRGLRSREVLMNAVAALFNPGEPIQRGALARYGRNFLNLSPEVTAISWLPAVAPDRVPDVLQVLRDSGIENPVIFGQNRRPLDVATLGYVPHVILDVEPKASAPVLLGGTASDWPERRKTIDDARATRLAQTPGPTRLFQPPHPFAFLVYAPVFSATDDYLGAVSFAYPVETLFRLASPPAIAGWPFSFHVYDDRDDFGRERLISIAATGEAIAGRDFTATERGEGIVTRKISFAGQPLLVAFEPTSSFGGRGWGRAAVFAAIGFLLTGLVVLAVWLVVQNAHRLAAEVAARRSAEDRLQILIHELNHRVRNVLTVAQSIVTRSLRPDLAMEDVKATVVGRYQALAGAMAILTDNEWRGADLHRILQAEMLPYTGRYDARGPDVTLRPRAAQTITLLLHELTTNSAKYGALSVPGGSVTLTWAIDMAGAVPEFHLTWAEAGGPPVSQPTRSGFGTQIIARVTPQDLAGRAAIDYRPEGIVYTLTASLSEITDQPAARPAGAA
ncbi:MAG TPA: HWE histidine kinase domain-containing protein [Microvirga sp.]|jgi:two-component sensor histidine kinase/CHASE1-domain containing sensor protein|nr:HWE histidine kinase domain-containing protein [Microvirga sp.]